MMLQRTRTRRRVRGTLVALAAAACIATPSLAQGLDSDKAIDTIIGSPVDEQEARSAAETDRLIAAIDDTTETIRKIRKTSDVDSVEIVFLVDAAAAEGGPPPEIEAKLAERETEIGALRQELEGNAMLFHAVDSRQVLLRDVIAVAFEDDRSVTIYAAAKPPG